MKRTVASSTVAIRSIASDLSSIVATLVGGTVVDQVDASAGWVKIVTPDGRSGWLRETDLGEVAEARATIVQERAELVNELEAVEHTQLETLVSQIEQVAQTKQAAEDREPVGWVFTADQAVAAIKNYTFHALIALFLYSFLWIPGVVMNVIFLDQANRDQQETGQVPEGKGCLLWLIWVLVIIPVAAIIMLLVIGITFAEE